MTVNLMRQLDYWLGIPLCFLFTLLAFILKPLRRKNNFSPKRLLFIKLSEMGSIVLSYPLLNKVKKEHPDAELFFLTFETNKTLVEILEIIPQRNIITIRENAISLFILDTLKALKRLRREKIDIVFDLELFSRFTAIFSYLSGAYKRVGFYRYHMEGLYRGELLTHKIQYNPLLHISKSFLSLWEAAKSPEKNSSELGLGIKNEEMVLLEVKSSEKIKQETLDDLKGFGYGGGSNNNLILLNPGEDRIPLREWPLKNFISLSRKLLEDERNYIVIVGAPAGFQKARLLHHSLDSKRCLDLTGRTSIAKLLSLCNLAKVLLVNDGGLAHLASLTTVKNFVFFGPESPQVYLPLAGNRWAIYSNFACSPCLSAFNHRKSACHENKCLKAITPEAVFNLLKQHL